MRIIFLNSWFGKAGKPFFDFIKKESPKTGIFCFMEFDEDLFNKVSKILNKHNGFIEKGMFLKAFSTVDCQVIYAKKGIKILSSKKLNLYRNSHKDTGFAFYISFEKNGKIVNLLNVHGRAMPGSKIDTPIRLKQSEKIINFFANKEGLKIIGGDFNLMPDTKSVKMFETAGYKNLIKDFGIKNTRNKLSWKQFEKEKGYVRQYFADFTFVSPNVKVKNFEVPYMEVSDHLPQILEVII